MGFIHIQYNIQYTSHTIGLTNNGGNYLHLCTQENF